MQALISKIEPRETGYRVAQVVAEGETFPVAVDLFWQECDNTVVADQFWFDLATNTFQAFPVPVITSPTNQPKSTGAQTL